MHSGGTSGSRRVADLAPSTYNGQFLQRIPKSLHRRLATRAAAEGVRLNQLAAVYLAHGLAEGSGAEPQRSDGQ